jgi:predicted porin
MKKSLLALAVLGAFAGVASAQSSVQVFGTIDLNGRYIKNDGSKARYSMSQDGINSSQLGFQGTEDLGGGLKAGFLLLNGFNADTGSVNASFFNRSSYARLWGGFGEIRLGHDYTPTFWNNTIYDVFGTNGLGDSSSVKQIAAPDFVRANNMVSYFLPTNLGGIFGQLSVGAGEAAAAGRYVGGRFGYSAGPLNVGIAYAQENLIGGAAPLTNAKYKTFNVGGVYNFGVATIQGFFNQDKVPGYKDNWFNVGSIIPLGQGEIHITYDYDKLNAPAFSNKVDKISLGYVYNLSKRTALYATAVSQSNGDHSQSSIGQNSTVSNANPATTPTMGSGDITALPTLGGTSKGAEFGIRHFF